MSLCAILLNPWAVLIFGYGALMIALAIAIYPLRQRMFIYCDELQHLERVTESDKIELNHLLDTCMSFRVGLMLPIAVVSVITDDLMGRKLNNPTGAALRDDVRFHQTILIYFLSIVVANPIAAIISIPLIFMSIFVDKLLGVSSIRQSVEEPIIRASLTTA